MQVGGDAILVNQGKKTTLPMSVVANISYDERLLEQRLFRRQSPFGRATTKLPKWPSKWQRGANSPASAPSDG